MIGYQEEIIEYERTSDVIEDWIECHYFTIASIASILSAIGIWTIAIFLINGW